MIYIVARSLFFKTTNFHRCFTRLNKRGPGFPGWGWGSPNVGRLHAQKRGWHLPRDPAEDHRQQDQEGWGWWDFKEKERFKRFSKPGYESNFDIPASERIFRQWMQCRRGKLWICTGESCFILFTKFLYLCKRFIWLFMEILCFVLHFVSMFQDFAEIFKEISQFKMLASQSDKIIEDLLR